MIPNIHFHKHVRFKKSNLTEIDYTVGINRLHACRITVMWPRCSALREIRCQIQFVWFDNSVVPTTLPMFAKKGIFLLFVKQSNITSWSNNGGTWMAALLAPTDYVNTNRLPGRVGQAFGCGKFFNHSRRCIRESLVEFALFEQFWWFPSAAGYPSSYRSSCSHSWNP